MACGSRAYSGGASLIRVLVESDDSVRSAHVHGYQSRFIAIDPQHVNAFEYLADWPAQPLFDRALVTTDLQSLQLHSGTAG